MAVFVKAMAWLFGKHWCQRAHGVCQTREQWLVAGMSKLAKEKNEINSIGRI